MRLFQNPAGDGYLFFDNLISPEGVNLSYDPDRQAFVTGAAYCANREVIGCNWIAAETGALCKSCAMTAMAPDLSMPNATEHWAQTEAAKRWVLDNLRTWHWFGSHDKGPEPVFHMLAEGVNDVVMGHAQGVVTISVEEADPVLLADRRETLDERFRTMVGHLRHELAHLLWWRLSVDPGFLEAFRSLFGDERTNYATALDRHYNDGPPPGWKNEFLTTYASAHPHEDWAETTAHLLHLVDIADSFQAVGHTTHKITDPDWSPYRENDPTKIIDIAASIALGINHINRSMGLPDLYPFVLSARSRQKLEFVHRWLSNGPALRTTS